MNSEEIINNLWEERDKLDNVIEQDRARAIVGRVIEELDNGQIRVAEVVNDEVVVHQWVKHAILLYFKVQQMTKYTTAPFEYLDKIPLKDDFASSKVRVVPGAIARRGSFLAPGVTLMPSYVNIGAYVDSGTMIDTWATVGSCAQIGKNVHLSGGVGIGGVLEPVGLRPVIIEDDVFVGGNTGIYEGIIV